MINPNPPAIDIVWHDSPESIHRAMWAPVAESEGMTYEELCADCGAIAECLDGEVLELTHEQEMQAILEQGCWGFAEVERGTIHAWAAPHADRGLVLHMLAHEIGHLTGDPHPDGLQEELRAEQFGRVAALAYSLLPPERVA